MVTCCSAYGCKNRFKKGSGIHYYGFPLNKPDILKKWLNAMKRDNFRPSSSSKICSEHFKSTEFLLRPGLYFKKLKDDAIPSIFPAFPWYYRTKQKPRKVKIRNQVEICSSGYISRVNTSVRLARNSPQLNIENIKLETNIEDIKLETNIEDIKLETNIEDIKLETNIEDISLETNIEDISLETNIEDISLEKAISLLNNIENIPLDSDIKDIPLETDTDLSVASIEPVEKTESEEVVLLNKKIKILQQKIRRRDRQLSTLKALVVTLRKQNRADTKLNKSD